MEIICWLPNSISLVSAEGTDMDFKAGLWVAKSKHEKNVMTLRQTLSLQIVKNLILTVSSEFLFGLKVSSFC